MFCFYCEDGTVVTKEAKNGSFWVDGTMVYAAVVLVVNLKIAHKTNTHTWVSTFLIAGSVIVFWIWLAFESAFPAFPDVYRMFLELLSQKDTYWILILCCWFNYSQFMIFHNVWVYLKQSKAETELQLKMKEDVKFDELVQGTEVENLLKNLGSEGLAMGEQNPVFRERRSTIGYAFS